MRATQREVNQHLELLAVMSGKKSVEDCKSLGKAPRKLVQHEAKEQEVIFTWARLQKGMFPELDLLYAVPNAAKRSPQVGAMMVRQGLKSGVPDMCLPIALGKYNGLYIELKVGKNKPTDNQNEWIDKLRKYGHKVEVCYGAESAINALKQYLGGVI